MQLCSETMHFQALTMPLSGICYISVRHLVSVECFDHFFCLRRRYSVIIQSME